MNCELIQPKLSAWLDGELNEHDAQSVETHLSDCEVCHTRVNELADASEQFRELMRAELLRSEQIAQQVVAALEQPPVPLASAASRSSGWRTMALILASAAAGFAAALLVFPPAKPVQAPTPIAQKPDAAPEVELELPVAVATLVRVIGEVTVQGQHEATAVSVSPLASYACPSNSVIETGADSCCELQTSNGSIVRVDHGTRLVVRLPDEIALDRGQIMCEAPEGKELRVVAMEAERRAPAETIPAHDFPIVSCKPNAGVWSVKNEERLQVTSTSGEVELVSKQQRQSLLPGESVEIVSGDMQPVSRNFDPLLATRWVHPLLMHAGPANPELKQRVDLMLARIGQSKVAHLYEDEIRSLGEHALLPLIRFLESPLAETDVVRARVASRIVADLAVLWTIRDLIQLLEHTDPQVRIDAATALERLTRQTQGRSAIEWKSPPEENAPAVELWNAWWIANRLRYPTLDAVKSSEPQL